jgi:UDP-glucose 4-epimerase
VFDVIDTVKRVSGVDFKVEIAPRRDGDPAQIVADSTQARQTLRWQPRFDDLSTIVAHALAWERELMKRRANASDPAGEANKKSAAAASSKRL